MEGEADHSRFQYILTLNNDLKRIQNENFRLMTKLDMDRQHTIAQNQRKRTASTADRENSQSGEV